MKRIFCDSNYDPEPSMPCTKRIGFCPNASVCAAAGCAAVDRNATAIEAATTTPIPRACIISPHCCIPETARDDVTPSAAARRVHSRPRPANPPPARAGSRTPRGTPGSPADAPASPAPASPHRHPRAPDPRTRRAARSRRRTRSPARPGRADPRSCAHLLPQLAAQSLASVVQRLVQRAACRGHPLGQYVDRHLVQRQCHEHGLLVLGQRAVDRPAQRIKKFPLLALLVGRLLSVGQSPPGVRLEHALAMLPGPAAQPHTRL